MATKLYDLLVATSEYNDRNGNKKRNWETVGYLFKDTDSHGVEYSYIMLKRCFNPAGITAREGADAIRISLFKPKDKQQQSSQQQGSYSNQQSQNFGNFDASSEQNTNSQPDFGSSVEEFPF